ncbi:MAG: hypothetical protein ACLFTH_03630 [Candidatus Woesearchaeota archaeon]
MLPAAVHTRNDLNFRIVLTIENNLIYRHMLEYRYVKLSDSQMVGVSDKYLVKRQHSVLAVFGMELAKEFFLWKSL